MAKLTKFEMNQIATDFIDREKVRPEIRHARHGYVESKARNLLESIRSGQMQDVACDYVHAVKHFCSVKNQSFTDTFRWIHATFYLLSQGFTYEMAKKKARLVLDEAKADSSHGLLKYVAPEHVFLFRQ